MVEMQVLGEIHLRKDDGSDLDVLLRQPKRLALLAYLASPCPGTWHRRDMLLALFWPDLDTSHARTALRNALYVLRQSLGDEVLRNRGDEEISVDPERVRTDLANVWDALRNQRPDDAIAMYGGDLLPGLYPPDSEGFQRWLDTERTRLKVAVSTAACARIDQLEREGKNAEALSMARKVSAINPDDETIVRRSMSLNETLGDRAGALGVFEAYRSRLAADFDAEPARETVELANRLRLSTTAPAPRRIVSRPDQSSPVTAEPAAPVSTAPQPSRRYGIGVTAAVTALVVVAALAWRTSQSRISDSVGKSTPLTSEQGLQVEAAISPDGRFVAYAKGNPNHLRIFVQRIGGGPAWPLSGDSANVELMPRWSPNNDEILFLARNNAYTSPTPGGVARIVAKGTAGDGTVRSASWSPDGDSIAIVRNDSLLVVPVRGAGSRLVGRGFQLHSCVWSPNGKWIACVSGNWIAFTPGPLFGNAAPSTVQLYPAAGGDPIPLTSKEDQSESPSWSADGRYLWILSNKDGTQGGVYAVPIGTDGHAAGAFVRAGITAESISLSAGRVAYTVPSRRANIWSVPIPRDSVVSMTSAVQMTTGNQVVELVNASRDGKWLMYDSDLHGNADIYRIPLGGTSSGSRASEPLTTDARPEFAAELSPDGTQFAWQRWVNGERHLFIKSVDDDAERELLPEPGDQGVPRWSPDGSSIVAWSHTNERGAVFVIRRASKTTWSRPSWRLDFGQLPVWSPDGRTIAFVLLDGSIKAIPADSGAVTTIYSPRAGTTDPLATYLVWKDPQTIWTIGQSLDSQGIWAISLTTGRARLLVRLDDPIGKSIGPAFSADSTHFYFALNERSSNVRWAELTHR